MSDLPPLTVADARKALADSGEVLYTKSYMQRCLAATLAHIDATIVMPPLDADVEWILGRPCFAVGHMAEALRQGGYAIKQHAEEEQAACAYWSLMHYVKHGAGWRKVATAELESFNEIIKARHKEASERGT